MTGLVEARAALERGRSVIVVAPPAVEQAEVVWELVLPEPPGRRPGVNPPEPTTVIACADHTAATEWADAAPPGRRVHPVTGLARSRGILESNPPEILAGAVLDLAALVARSALKLDGVRTIVVAWPEALTNEQGAALTNLLAEAPEARRAVLTWAPSRIASFLERHAYRAPLVGSAAVDADGRPAPPVGPARFAVVARAHRVAAVRAALDALNVPRSFVWRRGTELPAERVDAVLCIDLPSRDEFVQLATLGRPLLFVSPAQLLYARSIAAPLEPFSLPSEADRAQDRAEALRSDVASLLTNRDVDAELIVLGPLFERFDPAEVAAALLAMSHQPSAVSQPHAPTPSPWAKIYVSVGKKDRASARDLVGALIREAGLAKEQIGRVDVRETFSLVDVAPAVVAAAVRGLHGATIRGKRVAVREDRHG